MRIITLNTWGGRAGSEKLLSFFRKYKDQADIFCLQEIWSAPYTFSPEENNKAQDYSNVMVYGLDMISEALYDFKPFFRPHHRDNYGLLMLVKNSISIVSEEELFVHKYKGFEPEGDIGHHARNIQCLTLNYNDSLLTIINFHGLWNGEGKGDSKDRIDQSIKIKEHIESLTGEVVLCGDFNLLPTTQSIQIIENAGFRNLISENGITSTRTPYYTKPELFSDYVFVSKGLQIDTFEVLPDIVSDHSPLSLKIC